MTIVTFVILVGVVAVVAFGIGLVIARRLTAWDDRQNAGAAGDAGAGADGGGSNEAGGSEGPGGSEAADGGGDGGGGD